jgi:diguanylate cyclase (GGDEF)-like protein
MGSGSAERFGAAWWTFAGLVGITAAVTVCRTGLLEGLAPATAAMAAIGGGWALMLLVAPWRREIGLSRRRRELGALTGALRRSADGDAAVTPRVPPPAADLADLRTALEDLVRRMSGDRRAVERMKKRMGESIQRETQRRTLRLRREALTDPLTGLANRRALEQVLAAMPARPAGEASVVAMAVDLDRFKQVNDLLGHEVGDACLRFLSDLLRCSVRREDCPVRLGGDEFIVLMPGQTLPGARAVAERLARLFQQMSWPHESVARPSLSIGLAAVDQAELGDGAGLLRQADAALYEAKKAGRARVAG